MRVLIFLKLMDMTSDDQSQFTAVMDNPWETKKQTVQPASVSMEESLAELNRGSASSHQEQYQNLLSKGNSQAASQEFYTYESYSANFTTVTAETPNLSKLNSAPYQKSPSVQMDPWNLGSKPDSKFSNTSFVEKFSKVASVHNENTPDVEPIDTIKVLIILLDYHIQRKEIIWTCCI